MVCYPRELHRDSVCVASVCAEGIVHPSMAARVFDVMVILARPRMGRNLVARTLHATWAITPPPPPPKEVPRIAVHVGKGGGEGITQAIRPRGDHPSELPPCYPPVLFWWWAWWGLGREKYPPCIAVHCGASQGLEWARDGEGTQDSDVPGA